MKPISTHVDNHVPCALSSQVRTLVVWVTRRCSLRCAGCYMSAGQGPQDDLSLDTFRTALNTLPMAKGWELQIAGGEPSMVPQLVDDVASLARQNDVGLISLQTNGVDVDIDFIQMLRKHRIGVGLSLDGPPEVNERLRGGTKAVLTALSLFEEHAFPIGITSVVSRHNLDALPRLAALLAKFSCVRNLGLDLVRPVGRASEDWLPKPKDLHEAYNRLCDVLDWANGKRRYPITLRESRFVDMPKVPNSYCPAACGQGAVLVPDGTLYPCSSCVGLPEYQCGTAEAPDFTQLAMGLPIRSANCDTCRVPNCRGRCPSRSLFSEKAGLLDCVLRRAAWARREQSLTDQCEVRHVS